MNAEGIAEENSRPKTSGFCFTTLLVEAKRPAIPKGRVNAISHHRASNVHRTDQPHYHPASGRHDLVPATIERKDGRILFLKSPFSLKDEIKAMKGARWHGYEAENPIKAWSVEERSRTQIRRLLYRLLAIPASGGAPRFACQKSEIASGMVFNVSDRANALFYEAKRACQRCQRGFHRLYARE